MNHFLKQSFKLAHWGNAVESTIVPGNHAVKPTAATDNSLTFYTYLQL